jgi:drug/metabolite transporter (DMT)-like permease
MTAARPASGIALMIGAAFFFAALDALAKHMTATYPVLMIVWSRFFGQTVFFLAWLAATRRLAGALRTRCPGIQAARAVMQLVTSALFFASLSYMPLVEAAAIADVSPVLITLGAALFLGERIGPRRMLGVLAALAGALIIIRPGSDVFSPYAILPLAAAVTYAAFALLTRLLGPGESAVASVLFAGSLGAVIMSAIMPFVWQPVAAADLWAFAAIGLLGGSAQLLLVRAFQVAEASAIAPFAYVGLLFAAAWSAAAFGDWPDLWTILGSVVIVVAGLYVWHREATVARQRRTS